MFFWANSIVLDMEQIKKKAQIDNCSNAIEPFSNVKGFQVF